MSAKEGGGGGGEENGRKLLDAPVHLAQRLRAADDEASTTTVSGLWVDTGRTTVDQKKLEKADAKLKLKQEKKATKEKDTTVQRWGGRGH